MERANSCSALCKVYYRPIEAAIRWSGLLRHERRILSSLKEKRTPDPEDFPHWPALHLNTERIYDAIRNRELRCGIHGVTMPVEACLDHPDLTVRHIDLRAWMMRYYPTERPRFLFSPAERKAPPAFALNALQEPLFECEPIKRPSEMRQGELRQPRRATRVSTAPSETRPSEPLEIGLSPRSELTYQHIIGALLELLLGRSPSGQPYSSFRTQESVITVLVANHGHRLGISERTLQDKFAAARRSLSK